MREKRKKTPAKKKNRRRRRGGEQKKKWAGRERNGKARARKGCPNDRERCGEGGRKEVTLLN